ncbi:MAG: MBL fold metallo-hydrolase [Candidatus Krumholzibacteriota bacterium]|nr:MBL fold metallo-hydrolase [Candidatus Krumholzibacteriota bacterium]
MILKVAFLDVFHGDCAVVTFDEGEGKGCIVVDGGEKKEAARRLSAYLQHEQVEVIDLLVATHIDQDHVLGLKYLLQDESDKAQSWNRGEKRCIRHYWGPKPDPDWSPSSLEVRGSSLGRGAPPRLRMDYVIESVQQNQDLNKLVEEHIINRENLRYPSREDMPPLDIFHHVDLDLLAPDTQILDSEIKKKALSVSNAPYRKSLSAGELLTSGRRMRMNDLLMILSRNAEEIAEMANRNANNQSIVFKLSVKEGASAQVRRWSFLFTGDAEQESWEMMRTTAGVKKKLPSRVLKVPHHGSYLNGIDKKSFSAVNPEYNVVSVGQKHGLPDGESLNLIRSNKKRKLFCTEQNSHRNKPGPCGSKKRCIRAKKEDYRSIRFSIDTDSGEEKIEVFQFDGRNRRVINFQDKKIWCGERKWKPEDKASA